MTAFAFKQFSLNHAVNGMKVGTDATLLGAWAPFPSTIQNLLDVGTGTGILACMMAQRFPHIQIQALEPHPPHFKEAQSNFQQSPFTDRIRAKQIDLQGFVETTSPEQWDALICNPPFYQEKMQSADPNRDWARNIAHLPPEMLFSGAQQLLKPQGYFALIIPIEIQARVEETTQKQGFRILNRCLVSGRVGKPANRVLYLFIKSEEPRLPVVSQLFLETQPRERSSDFQALMEPFLK